MLILLVTALFSVVFVRTLIAYARTRDPLQGTVSLVFCTTAIIFLLALSGLVEIQLPVPVRNVAVFFMLGQPYLTVRLVSAIRDVPRWALHGSLAIWVLTAAPVLLRTGQQQLSLTVLTVSAAGFFVTEMLAAVLIGLEARRRPGAPRARLTCAAVATAAMAFALVAIFYRSENDRLELAVDSAGRILALVSAIGHTGAFAPPEWLRRLWAATATYRVSQHLLHAPPTEAPKRTWQRYAETVRETAGADGTIVLLLSRQGRVVEIASTGVRPGGSVAAAQLSDLLAARQPVDSSRSQLPLAATFAARASARFVTAVPLRIPPAGKGALLLLHRHRTLFGDDDARLLASLGGQAGILAERGGVLAEQERLTAELAESIEALQRASKAKSDFLANMSHELRTPLNSIIGFSELMRAEEQERDLRMVPDEWIEHIHSSGRRLLALINDILDLTKVEAGRMELRLEPVELRESVRDMLAALTPVADKKHLRLVADVPAGLTIQVDRMRFRQIIDNLLSNALKFTPEHGTISVTAREVGHNASVAVADTGTGIAAADVERVFAEFQQVGDVAAQQSGTGLGLALTRRLAEAHGGKVELESEIGVGSTFTVHLPIAPDRPVDAPPAEADDSEYLPQGGILMIEDEAGAARLLRAYLEEAGYRVMLSTSGQAGLTAARRFSPQAIILDLLLPDIDGWEVLRQLKVGAATRDTPVVIVTVIDEPERGLELGAADYLVKPIDREELLERMSRHVLIPPSAVPTSRILVIDDDPGTLRIVETNLRRQGYVVSSATSGVEGLRMARGDTFDLIICDLLMPDMDGYAVVAALSSDARAHRPSIVIFTELDITDADRARLDGHVAAVVRKSDAAQIGLRDWLAWMANQSQRSAVPAGAGQVRSSSGR